MKSRQPLFLVTLLLTLPLSAEEFAISPPETLDTSKPAQMLKYNLEVGKKFDTDMTISQTMSMAGQEVNSTFLMGFLMDIQPGEGDAAKKAVMSYTRTGIDMAIMGQQIKYDSADAEAQEGNPLAMMGKIVGKEITMMMDDRNEVLSVEGIDALTGEFAANPAMAEQMKTFTDKDQLTQMSNLWISEVFPGKEISPGDTWDFSYSMNAAAVGEITYKGTATLHGYTTVDGADVAVVDLDGEIDMDLSGIEGDAAAMGMELTGGKSRSILYWDNSIGYMRKMDAVQEMKMSMQNPQTGEAIEMPLKQKIGMKVGVSE